MTNTITAYDENGPDHQVAYAAPGASFDDRVKFNFPDEHRFVLWDKKDEFAPAQRINQINRWCSNNGVRQAVWRTPRGPGNLILVSIKARQTAMLFKLTFAGDQ